MSLPVEFPHLFWDVDPPSVDEDRYAEFIIERVLEEGTLQAVQTLFGRYSRERIIGVIRSSRRISRRTGYFWQAYLDIQEPIACIQRPSRSQLGAPWE